MTLLLSRITFYINLFQKLIPPNECLDGSSSKDLFERLPAVNDFEAEVVFISVQSDEHRGAIWSFEHHCLDGRVALCRLAELDGVGRQELAEVSEGVEHRLSVELAGGDVDDDGRVDEVADPVRAALGVQRQIPVNPAGREVLQIRDDVVGVALRSLPTSEPDAALPERAFARLRRKQKDVFKVFVKVVELRDVVGVVQIPMKANAGDVLGRFRIRQNRLPPSVNQRPLVVHYDEADVSVSGRFQCRPQIELYEVSHRFRHETHAVEGKVGHEAVQRLVLGRQAPDVDAMLFVGVKELDEVLRPRLVDFVARLADQRAVAFEVVVRLHPGRRRPRRRKQFQTLTR